MRTVIQEMISIVEMDFENGVEITMRAFHGMLKKAVQKEKEQLISFHIETMKNGLITEGEVKWKEGYEQKIRKEAEQYYLQVFKKVFP